MCTPIESVIAFSDCKGFSAQPEVLKPHRLQAFRVCWCKCTEDAKGKLEKSIRYEANFMALCKCLQENIRILSHASSVSGSPKATRIVHNKLIVKDKADFRRKGTEGWENRPMVNQLHSFSTTRGGSQGSC